MQVFNSNSAKMTHHSKVFARARYLKCSDLKNKAIFKLICN